MDFLERVFHVDPDGGSGTIEALYFALIFFAAVLFIRALRRLT